jgi:acyl carrier protein
MALKERVFETVAQVMGVSADQIDERSSPDTIPNWDSLQHMNLILALEEKFGVQFTDDQIVELVTVGAILTTLAELAPQAGNAGRD